MKNDSCVSLLSRFCFANLARAELLREFLHLLLAGQEESIKYFVAFLNHFVLVSSWRVVNEGWKKADRKCGSSEVIFVLGRRDACCSVSIIPLKILESINIQQK